MISETTPTDESSRQSQPIGAAWLRRALTVALCFAYTPAFIASLASAKNTVSALLARQTLFGLGLVTMVSCIAVSLAFLALTVFARSLAERTRKRLFVFLLAYWLPHTLLVAFWGFLDTVGGPGAWID